MKKLLLTSFLSLLFILCLSTKVQAAWETSIINSTDSSVYKSEISSDSNNRYFVVYQDDNGLEVAVSTNEGLNWTSHSIDPLFWYGNFSIDVNDEDKIVIIYDDYDNYNVKMAVSTDHGDTWNVTTLLGDFNYYYSVFIIAPNNDYLLAYVDATTEDIMFTYSTNKGSTWSTALTASSTSGIQSVEDIASNAPGHYIIGATFQSGPIFNPIFSFEYYSTVDYGQNWDTTTYYSDGINKADFAVDNTSNYLESRTDLYSNMGLDNYSLQFGISTNNGMDWTETAVNNYVGVSGEPSITVDNNNHYYIFRDGQNIDLWLSSNDGDDWTPFDVDSTGNSYSNAESAVDKSGNIIVSAFDTTDSDLKFFRLVIDYLPPLITLNPIDNVIEGLPVTISGTLLDAMSQIVSLEYKVDGGNWEFASASDGTFDELEEEFSITIYYLTAGTHIISFRSTDTQGNVHTAENYVTAQVEIYSLPPMDLVKSGSFIYFYFTAGLITSVIAARYFKKKLSL